MSDILVRNLGRMSHVEGISAVGKCWLEDNIYFFDKVEIIIQIPTEFIQEFIEELRRAELTVEEK